MIAICLYTAYMIGLSPLFHLDTFDTETPKESPAELSISTLKKTIKTWKIQEKNSRTISQIRIGSVNVFSLVVPTSLNVEKEHPSGARRQGMFRDVNLHPPMTKKNSG